MTIDPFEAPNVSRETLDRLKSFEALVQKWTKSINLVSQKDAQEVWQRHIIDSLQVFQISPTSQDWLDLGSGGGFPGIVVSILDSEFNPMRKMTLVDSDQRKCAFLRTVVRELGLNARVIATRIEVLPPQQAAVVSARALGTLGDLLGYASRHLKQGGTAIFPKGRTWKEEHNEAQKAWSYQMEAFKSKTNNEAVVLQIKDILSA